MIGPFSLDCGVGNLEDWQQNVALQVSGTNKGFASVVMILLVSHPKLTFFLQVSTPQRCWMATFPLQEGLHAAPLAAKGSHPHGTQHPM